MSSEVKKPLDSVTNNSTENTSTGTPKKDLGSLPTDKDTSGVKTLDNSSRDTTKDSVPDVEFFGKDVFKLISKASSKSEGWMKSTKAMQIKGVGVVIQTTTQQGDNICDTTVFVPGCRIVTETVLVDEVPTVSRSIEKC